MCGIVGAFPLRYPECGIGPEVRKFITLYLHNETLYHTVERGKDATGVAVSYGPKDDDEEGKPFWAILKQPVKTVDFYANDGTNESRYQGQDKFANAARFLQGAVKLNRPLLHVLGHTRHKTMGSEYNPMNNHPIMAGNIIGIHNGGVDNYKRIYELHKSVTPAGEVDSEAIMQLLAENAPDRELTLEDIKFVCERIEGDRAVVAYNKLHPNKVAFFHSAKRPLELAYIPELGLAMITSKKEYVEKAMEAYQRLRLIYTEQLPKLSVSWKFVMSDEGGIIDVSKEAEPGKRADEMFSTFRLPDTKAEYKENYKSTNDSSSEYPYTGQTPDDDQEIEASGEVLSGDADDAAVLTDISDYDSNETVKGPVKDNVTTLGEDDVLDDKSPDSKSDDEEEDGEDIEDVEEGTEDDEADFGSDIGNTYSSQDLRTRAENYYLGKDGKNDPDLMPNRFQGNAKKLIAISSISEDDAEDALQMIYPEAFGDGYIQGFREGAEESQEYVETLIEDVDSEDLKRDEEELKRLERHNGALSEDLVTANTKIHHASNIMANLKCFIMACILSHDIAGVKDGEMIFDEQLKELLKVHKGFSKVDLEQVKAIFSDKDKHSIENSLVSLARELRQRHHDVEEGVRSRSKEKATVKTKIK